MPFTTEIIAKIDGRRAELQNWLEYEGKSDKIRVPPGFWTDFASVPQFITWLIPTMGAYSRAAILHDYLCVQLAAAYKRRKAARGWPTGGTVPAVDARQTDAIFRRIMREEGVPPLRRWLIWTGVRWGALGNPARREGWLRDAPAVLALSLLALPIVLPASIVIGLGSFLYWILETALEVAR